MSYFIVRSNNQLISKRVFAYDVSEKHCPLKKLKVKSLSGRTVPEDVEYKKLHWKITRE